MLHISEFPYPLLKHYLRLNLRRDVEGLLLPPPLVPLHVRKACGSLTLAMRPPLLGEPLPEGRHRRLLLSCHGCLARDPAGTMPVLRPLSVPIPRRVALGPAGVSVRLAWLPSLLSSLGVQASARCGEPCGRRKGTEPLSPV